MSDRTEVRLGPELERVVNLYGDGPEGDRWPR